MADDDTVGGGLSGSGGDASGGMGVGGWTAAIGIGGLAISAIGQFNQSKAQDAVYQSDINTANLEMQVNAQRQQQMTLNFQRQSIENLRNVQKTQAQGMAAAVAGGAQFGSGAKGGQAQAAAQGAWTMESLSQNFQIGQKMFALDNQIDQQKIAKAQAETQANTAAGWTSIGGDITKGAGNIAQLATLLPTLMA
jgi:hypothetical protein